jgi:hemoglobin
MLNKALKTLGLVVLVMGAAAGQVALAGDKAEPAADAAPTLYERLGGWDSISQIVHDTIAFHQANPEISHYFEGVDAGKLAVHVTTFFSAGTGGPQQYQGRDMTTTHAHMNMSDADFDSAVADVLKALDKNGIGDTEKAEVAAILESLRPAVMGTAAT